MVCHIRMHWGVCNQLEHRLAFDKKKNSNTNGECIIRNSTSTFYFHAPVPYIW